MTPHTSLLPFADYWWFYSIFMLFVLALLSFDLGVLNRKEHVIGFREAALTSAFFVALALAWNYGFYRFLLINLPANPELMAIPGFDAAARARDTALEFLAGYVVEYSLSVDNIFVFVVLLNYFQVPARYQHRVLFFGILGALVFRGLFIAAGALLLRFEPITIVFGLFLVYTGWKVMVTDDGARPDPEANPLIRAFRRFVPVSTASHGKSFFVREAGRWVATPLFVTLLCVEITDVVFAIDSVPAIFALTHEPLVVFTSNVFAILGLRAMYFMLREAVDRFHLLKYGLGVVLVFVGLKMTILNRLYDGHFPIRLSLGIIVGVIGAAIAGSLAFPKKDDRPVL